MVGAGNGQARDHGAERDGGHDEPVASGGGVEGGGALLAASAPAELRPRSEGIGEASMGLAAAAGARTGTRGQASPAPR